MGSGEWEKAVGGGHLPAVQSFGSQPSSGWAWGDALWPSVGVSSFGTSGRQWWGMGGSSVRTMGEMCVFVLGNSFPPGPSAASPPTFSSPCSQCCFVSCVSTPYPWPSMILCSLHISPASPSSASLPVSAPQIFPSSPTHSDAASSPAPCISPHSSGASSPLCLPPLSLVLLLPPHLLPGHNAAPPLLSPLVPITASPM